MRGPRIAVRRLAHGEGLPLPAYETAGAAGADLRAALAEPLVLQPGERGLVPSGFACAIPEGFEMQVRPRSGLAARHGVTVLNAPGTVDSDYRGEVMAVLVNLGPTPFTVRRGDRIAQLVVAPVVRACFAEAESLAETARGAGGFGSTGRGYRMDGKAAAFRELHRRGAPFVIPNPWDVGSARLLHSKGFKALATTSAGHAYALGRLDGAVSWDEKLAHCREMVAATPLPVSADLEYGKGASPESVGEAITEAMATGLAGASIEDFSGDPGNPIYDGVLALERIEAAVAAKGSSDFVLTARCENFLWDRPDLGATIRRLLAFEAAGADVVYAPGLRTLAEIREVCAAATVPVNVVVGIGPANFKLAELAEAGVARISTGSSLAKTAYAALLAASDEILSGSFDFAAKAAASGEIAARLRPPVRP